LATSRCPLCIFWQKLRQPTLYKASLNNGSDLMSCISYGSILRISPPLWVFLFCWLSIIIAWKAPLVNSYNNCYLKNKVNKKLRVWWQILFTWSSPCLNTYTQQCYEMEKTSKGKIKGTTTDICSKNADR
jgi:hypothetical protein